MYKKNKTKKKYNLKGGFPFDGISDIISSGISSSGDLFSSKSSKSSKLSSNKEQILDQKILQNKEDKIKQLEALKEYVNSIDGDKTTNMETFNTLKNKMKESKLIGNSKFNPLNFIGHPGDLVKFVKQFLSLSGKTPFGFLSDIVVNSIMNIVALYIYFPSVIINMPNATLENLLPDKRHCKLLFGNTSTCKKKLKCFMTNCSVTQDKQGYYEELDEKRNFNSQKGGKNIRKHNRTYKKKHGGSELDDYMNFGRYHSLSEKFVANDNIKKTYAQLKNIFDKFKNKNGKFVTYDNVQMLYRDVILNHINYVHIYKLLCIYEMMDHVFSDTITNVDMESSHMFMNMKHEEIKIHWPLYHSLLDIFTERIECITSQLKDEKPKNSNTHVTFKNCYKCKNCTMKKTVQHAFNKLITEMFEQRIQLHHHIEDMFQFMIEEFVFEKYTFDQYLALFVKNFNILKKPRNFNDLKTVDSRLKHLFMIPKINNVKNKSKINHFKIMFAFMKKYKIDSILRYCLMLKLYNITQNDISKCVFDNKKKISDIIKVSKKYFIQDSHQKIAAKMKQFQDKVTTELFYDNVENVKIDKSKAEDIFYQIIRKSNNNLSDNSNNIIQDTNSYEEILGKKNFEYKI